MAQIKDVFDVDKAIKEHGNKILLLGGVGSGKSTFVTDVLCQRGSVLFITSRKAKVQEDVNCTCFSEAFHWYTNGNQTLITNAKLAKLVERITDDYMKDLDEFIDHFDYIVVDEVHSIATDSAYAEACSSVLSFIEYVAEKGINIICMTGTPEPVQKYFDDNNWYTADYRKICDYVHPKLVALIQKNQILNYMTESIESCKVIYFVNRVDRIAEICKELIEKDIVTASEIAVAVAKSREKEYFDNLKSIFSPEIVTCISESSEKAYKGITSEKHLLPDNCKILFSTSVLKEGVNIKNPNMIMFCENHVLTNLIQFFGRARKAGSKVYIIEDVAEHPIKQNELLYYYAVKNEMLAANQFYTECIDTENNPFSVVQREQLIKHVSKNPYIYFDYIMNEYKVFCMKYDEETRLKKNFAWKDEIIEHCKEYGIKYLWFDNPNTYRIALQDLVVKKTKFLGKEKIHILKNLLKVAYGLKYKVPKKINEELAEKNISIRIHHGKGSAGVERNVVFWQVLSVDDYEKIKEK